MDNNESITKEEFIQRVQNTQGVEIRFDSTDINRLIKPYNYRRFLDDETENCLKTIILINALMSRLYKL